MEELLTHTEIFQIDSGGALHMAVYKLQRVIFLLHFERQGDIVKRAWVFKQMNFA